MRTNGNHQNSIMRVVLLLVVMLFHGFRHQTAIAQMPAEATNPALQHLLREVDALKQEVDYLRRRDSARLVSENSRVEGVPAVSSVVDAESYCSPNKCETQAPCIECPHVSTLNPYFNLHVYGAVRMDMLFNSARPASAGTPFFLLPASIAGLNEATFDANTRQSSLGAVFGGPQIGDWQIGGRVNVTFYNDNLLADQYGILPVLAWGEFKNEDWRFAAGLQTDLFNPRETTGLQITNMIASGDTGKSTRAQLRLERYLRRSEFVQWTIQAAISEPISTTIDPSFRFSEDNGWPNIEGRIAVGIGEEKFDKSRPFESSISGVIGQLRTTPPPPKSRVVADVWGLGADFRWQTNDYCGVMAEVYAGQGLGTYNGAILQNISLDSLQAIRTAGGWFEVFLYWTPCLHSHIGYGIDDPVDRDVTDTPEDLGRVQNETFFCNVLWDVSESVRIGFEFTRRETKYKTVLDNEGVGFHTQFRWAF